MAQTGAAEIDQYWLEALAGIDARTERAASPITGGAAPVLFVGEGGLAEALGLLEDAALGETAAAFAAGAGFTGAAGKTLLLPGADGAPRLALFGCGSGPAAAQIGAAPRALPESEGGWRPLGVDLALEEAALEWLLGAYAFTRYKAEPRPPARLALDPGAPVRAEATGAYFARDLVNTPTSDLGPVALEAAARALAESEGAEIAVIEGDALLDANLPMIHAVGRAAMEAPRLIDIRWRAEETPSDAPLVTLVGKGVCFDTGGLDVKPPSAMRNMKKDMGGAAAALGAATILMRRKAQIRLRVLIPAVENAIGPDAFRPGDILQSRGGLSVEIDNTDAEGRLVLADALCLAAEEAPALIFDFSTLTGAARVALGPEIPALFTDDDALAAELAAHGAAARDPLWRLPLYAPYAGELSSSVADVKNSATSGLGGAITAALFLKRFVDRSAPDAGAAPIWAHFDLFAWNLKTRPGRPEGGEAQTARAAARTILARYGAQA